jgi:hypothetical protein
MRHCYVTNYQLEEFSSKTISLCGSLFLLVATKIRIACLSFIILSSYSYLVKARFNTSTFAQPPSTQNTITLHKIMKMLIDVSDF